MSLIIEPALANHVPYKTDDTNNYPLLWRDPNFMNENFIAEVKKDGSRYLLYLGAPGKSKLLSKRISDVTGQYVDKTENCPHLTRVDVPKEFWGTVLDGEMVFAAHAKSEGTTTIMGCGPEKAVKRQKEQGWLEYHVYDMPHFKQADLRQLPLKQRREIMKLATQLIKAFIPHVSMCKAVAHTDAERLYNKVIAMGGEGIMLKDLRSTYGQGWWKVKKTITQDVVIIGFKPPERISKKSDGITSETYWHQQGLIGAIIFGMYRGDKLVNLGTCSGMTEIVRREISANKESFIGRVFEIKAQERTKTGKFRHGQFKQWRYDKSPRQCIDKMEFL